MNSISFSSDNGTLKYAMHQLNESRINHQDSEMSYWIQKCKERAKNIVPKPVINSVITSGLAEDIAKDTLIKFKPYITK